LTLVEAFQNSEGALHNRLAEVLSNRIEYIITKLLGHEHDVAAGIINELISMERVSEIIEFLKRNKNVELEDRLVEVIQPRLQDCELLAKECGLFLPDSILEKLGLKRLFPPARKREEKVDKKLVRRLYVVLAFALGFFPLLYVLRYYDRLDTMPFIQHLKYFVLNFNVNFSYYTIAVNVVYLILLFFSRLNIKRAAQLWELKSMTMLFKPRMLPSVSIIAPAYNEETTIIESANSLLSLKYRITNLNHRKRRLERQHAQNAHRPFRFDEDGIFVQRRLKHYPIRGHLHQPLYSRSHRRRQGKRRQGGYAECRHQCRI
jgi:hypothetical protein